MANNKPIFTGRTRTEVNKWPVNQHAYTDGSPNNITVFTANSTAGSFLEKIRVKVLSTTTTPTVMKFFTSPADAHYQYDEIYIPATTVTANSTTPVYEINMNLITNESFFAGCTVAPTGSISITAVGGDYVELS